MATGGAHSESLRSESAPSVNPPCRNDVNDSSPRAVSGPDDLFVGTFSRTASHPGVLERSLSSRENLRASVSWEANNSLVIVISVLSGLEFGTAICGRIERALSKYWQCIACAKCSRRSSLFRQFADFDHARCCQDCNFIVICLYDVCDAARPVSYNVDTGLTPQAVVDQPRST